MNFARMRASKLGLSGRRWMPEWLGACMGSLMICAFTGTGWAA